MWMPPGVASTWWTRARPLRRLRPATVLPRGLRRRPGAQAIARAAHLLRLVTAAGDGGAAVGDLALDARLTRPTAHRLLSALRAEGLVDRDEATGHWLPGPELYLMGSVAASRFDITATARDIVRSLAVRTEESAFLSVRRGDETVCLVREDGSFPIRSFVLSEGVRFPRGGLGGARDPRLPAAPGCGSVSRAASELVEKWGSSHSPARLRARIADTQGRGYAVNPGLIVEGSWGVGAAVFTRAGDPQWALSLTGVEFRFAASASRSSGASCSRTPTSCRRGSRRGRASRSHRERLASSGVSRSHGSRRGRGPASLLSRGTACSGQADQPDRYPRYITGVYLFP